MDNRFYLCLLIFIVLLVRNSQCLTCHECSYIVVSDYSTATQSNVDSALTLIQLSNNQACSTAPDSTTTKTCSSGQICIMENLSVTLDFSGAAVVLSVISRDCATLSTSGDVCYVDTDSEFSTTTASTQSKLTSVSLNISSVGGYACLCSSSDQCNNNQNQFTTTTAATTTTTSSSSPNLFTVHNKSNINYKSGKIFICLYYSFISLIVKLCIVFLK